MTSSEFRLPDLGEGLTDAEIVNWLVSVGDTVAVDQPVVEVETAKASVEVPVPFAGTVTAVFGRPGERVPVGAPLLSVASATAEPPAATPADGQPVSSEYSGNVLVGYGTSASPGRRRARLRSSASPASADPAMEAGGPPTTPAETPATVGQRDLTGGAQVGPRPGNRPGPGPRLGPIRRHSPV